MNRVVTKTEYRLIPGFPGYRVGSDGSVWSLWAHRGKAMGTIGTKWCKLKPAAGRTGYLQVVIKPKGGRAIGRKVHQLVLEAFVEARPEGCQARHFPDRNPANNRLENLQWSTPSKNMMDKHRHGTMPIGIAVHSCKLSPEKVERIRVMVSAGLLTYQQIGQLFGVCKLAIQDIVSRKTWAWLP